MLIQKELTIKLLHLVCRNIFLPPFSRMPVKFYNFSLPMWPKNSDVLFPIVLISFYFFKYNFSCKKKNKQKKRKEWQCISLFNNPYFDTLTYTAFEKKKIRTKLSWHKAVYKLNSGVKDSRDKQMSSKTQSCVYKTIPKFTANKW